MTQYIYPANTEAPSTAPSRQGAFHLDSTNERVRIGYSDGAATDWKDPLGANSLEVTGDLSLDASHHGRLLVVNMTGSPDVATITLTQTLALDFACSIFVKAGSCTVTTEGGEILYCKNTDNTTADLTALSDAATVIHDDVGSPGSWLGIGPFA